MTGQAGTDLPLRLRLALHATTAAWRPPGDLSAAELDTLRRAARNGWRFRQASPRWDTIWRPQACDLAHHRVFLLPARGFGMRDDDLRALSPGRLHAAGLRFPQPAAVDLHTAEHAPVRAMVPGWCDDCPPRRGGRR
ncbi:hypothetical protein [Rhodobaculum claviforme]|uniref:Uncharacterized protein n=1 Tax=Rhodobaculum claviforme TaxID=1549854 RepID=A0A934TML9_9RHOB|nr:hypothetical protein [Rhodobaculum claviforme]MBK5928296.1 hypothetical protein [Rhodobaculum claviforme]